MKVFYSGLQHNYYDPGKGSSFEHETFYKTLAKMPDATVRYFPFETILAQGKRVFNEELLEEVKKERPDVLFAFMVSDEFEPAILEEIKKYTTTVAWFADDSWRFHNYSRIWAKHFTWAVTTYSWMPEFYRKAGQPNVIRSQWAANTALYEPTALSVGEKRPEVSFVGLWSRPRGEIVNAIQESGIGVEVYGGGWPSARRASQEEMIQLFGSSKISLALNPSPGLWNTNSLGRLVARRSLNRIVPDLHLYSNIRSWLDRSVPQIKGRHFEIPACGGFLLTSKADDLETFYVPGKEIVFYNGLADYIAKIKYYLGHDEERERIARAGYERTLREHTYEKRFREIFTRIFQ